MKIDEVKKQRQAEGVDRWFKNKCHGILAWATGVGKTFGAILAIERIERQRQPSYLILVPSQPLVKQWKGVLKMFFEQQTIDRIIIKTVNEAHNETATYVTDVLIIDEVHEYTTDEKIKFLDRRKVEYKALLCLTASTTDFSFKRILQFVPIVDEITEKEASEKGFIAQFHEYNVCLELTPAEKEEYDSITEIVSLQMPKFNNSLDAAQKCLNGGYMFKNGNKKFYTAIQWSTTLAISNGWSEELDMRHETHRNINDLWNPRKIVGYARQLIKAIRDRKTLLEHSVRKCETAYDIIKKFNKVKTIVFSESTDVVDELYEQLEGNEKVVRFHSNLEAILAPSRKTGKMIKKGTTVQRNEAIDDFTTGRARILLATRAVDKGLNVPDIRLGLTISGSSKVNQYDQRGGRVKRTEEGEDSTSSLFGDNKALLINLYLKDTQDEVWLKSRQKNVQHFIYDVSDIDDISYTPPPNEKFVVDF